MFVHWLWFVKYVFSTKIWFVKTSTWFLKYESRVVKSNPDKFLTFPSSTAARTHSALILNSIYVMDNFISLGSRGMLRYLPMHGRLRSRFNIRFKILLLRVLLFYELFTGNHAFTLSAHEKGVKINIKCSMSLSHAVFSFLSWNCGYQNITTLQPTRLIILFSSTKLRYLFQVTSHTCF